MSTTILQQPPNAPNDSVKHLAHVICSLTFHGRDQKLFALLDKHKPNIDQSFVDAQGYSPLHYAAVSDNDSLLSGLCARAPRLLSARDRNGDTPLHTATQANKPVAVKILLEAGASPNIVNYNGVAPLHLASAQANVVLLRLLLDAGTFVGLKDGNDATGLHWVAVADADDDQITECIDVLLRRGAFINALDDERETALHWAARECNKVTVRALLDAGADPSLSNESSETAVRIANLALEASGTLNDMCVEASPGEMACAERCVELLADALRRLEKKSSSASPSSSSSSSANAPMFTVML